MKYCLLLVFILISTIAFAVEVPPITASEFVIASSEAHWIWSALAGTGTAGAIFYALMRMIWKLAKPYLDEWVAARKIEKLYAFAEVAVRSTAQTYSESCKAANKDGKLTEEEIKEARSLAQSALIAIAKTQGIDIAKEYGLDVVNWLIEHFVSKIGIESKALKAVAVPLSESRQPVPEPPLPDLAYRRPSGS